MLNNHHPDPALFSQLYIYKSVVYYASININRVTKIRLCCYKKTPPEPLIKQFQSRIRHVFTMQDRQIIHLQRILQSDWLVRLTQNWLYRIKHCFLRNYLCINSEGLYVKFVSELPDFIHR